MSLKRLCYLLKMIRKDLHATRIDDPKFKKRVRMTQTLMARVKFWEYLVSQL